MEKKLININGKELAYYRKGNSYKKVFFIHGNSLSSKIWQKQFESELLSDFELIAIDLPGHGDSYRSNSPELDYSYNGICDVIMGFINEITTEKSILVGHSLGGHIMLELIPKLKQVGGLIVTGTPPLQSMTDIPQAFVQDESFMLTFKNDLSDIEIKLLAQNSFYGKIPDFVYSDIKNTHGKLRESIAQSVLQDEFSILKSMGGNAAIFHGEYDKKLNLDYINHLGIASLWENKVHIIENAGHCPQYENPVKFNELLFDFISNLDQ